MVLKPGASAIIQSSVFMMNEGDIVSHFNLTQPTISHHLTLLRNANLVTARHEGKYVFYRTNPACVTECCGEILSRFNIQRRGTQDH